MKNNIITLINKALKEVGINENLSIELTKPKSKENGDYATNIALKLANKLKMEPMVIAENITEKINSTIIEKIDIKSPGFINFFLKKDYLFNNLNRILEEKDNYGKNNIGNGKKYNIEFVSANPTGILHLGNARGGAYGDSLARILTFCGFDVTKEYYINDAGNQINNLALSIQARYFELCGKESNMPENGYYGEDIKSIAKKIYNEYKDSYIEKEIDYYKELGTKELLARIVEDLKEYRIEYDVFTSEKAITQKYNVMDIITKMKSLGYIYEKDGATWFACSKIFDDKDHVLIKEDKTLTYLVPDIAYHLDKYKRGYDRIIDILGTDHHGYVARLKSSVQALGNNPDILEVKLLQLVRLVENGEIVKMSKRTGKTVTLKELIDEVGVNAARYYFSKYSLDTQMDFDLNQAKANNNENPVYYVSYAYARICSILKEKDNLEKIDNYNSLNNEDAYNVLEKLYDFQEIVQIAALKELPHLITQYVYELATLFHMYYAKNRILTDNEEITKENINLIKAVKITLFNSLNLIGIIPPEKM